MGAANGEGGVGVLETLPFRAARFLCASAKFYSALLRGLQLRFGCVSRDGHERRSFKEVTLNVEAFQGYSSSSSSSSSFLVLHLSASGGVRHKAVDLAGGHQEIYALHVLPLKEGVSE